MKFRTWILFALLVLLPLQTVGAQPSIHIADQQQKKPAPLFMGINNGKNQTWGDLWTYDTNGALQRTRYGYNGIPILSNDGTKVAYASLPEFVTKPKYNESEGGLLPYNIWVLDAATGNAQRIADQPKDATRDPEAPRLILRSEPSWSPSGRQLAWTEIEVDSAAKLNTDLKTERLVVYDLDAKSSRVIVTELPAHRSTDTVPNLSEVAWGLPGIAVLTHVDNVKTFPEKVTLYTPTGKQISQSKEFENSGFQFSQLIWIEDAGRFYLTNITGDIFLDPETGTEVKFGEINAIPELYSTLNPNGVTLYYGDKTVGEGNPVWLIAYRGEVKGEMAAQGRYYYLSGIAISPDGERAAYIVYPGQGTDGGLYIYRNGARAKLSYSGVQGVAWGPVAWRLRKVPFFGVG
jgi:hypothetical protein